MQTISFGSKHKPVFVSESSVRYLISPSEPTETTAAVSGCDRLGFRNRYLARRRVMRTIRRLRRG